ncbi:2-carboxy-1,4-naphthoquinone phytyltransferase [Limnoraphis robusta Tam1]|uniref:2-carboxy-1,4-naphthoquinone phytyltransferase n=1 Tax=Limnoraphis robusta CCNP1315 TaxID=3110306 RepID=A0ABU5U5T2_9CYAN|nr:2-carboxy-1,4-naphthoquinone phytyltransferase [Limnoraphis robusta]MEA5496543.1 2-carboxy-1,4-naphthoquinone phytyltransferase [Limnoraphis robusta BA-68 BA1]MEA5522566.1 2-carboxy-1,4-naphthoquinone phytyltransferase [Limnoraphis robusta CCNP1315]MEA5539745.1 2-carboxy-1,4-naphthoquinone phytyltransferase [Limnoraphis robusta Tam1]MEA5545074.1 2-carboxy-1,4-naphthoquinone phytyltransferase [Limnoraphis robusta CCNP1324]
MTTKLITENNQNKLWLAAIKPPMYSVAIMPIWLGTAIAWFEQKYINLAVFTTFISAAILILAWENIHNDVFDSETGIDKNKAHSLVNLTQKKNLVFVIGLLCLTVGILEILLICWWQKDLTVIGLILACCFLGYAYQGPPFRLGYQGLGEFLCFFAFGPLAVSAAYYSQTQSWSSVSFAASIILGISTTLILFCSHFHQVEDDLAAGKYSPIVRLGTQRGAQLLPIFCGIIFAITGIGVILGTFPVWTLLSFVGLPSAIKLCRHVGLNHDKPELISNCKYIAVSLHFWSGLLLGLGFVIHF